MTKPIIANENNKADAKKAKPQKEIFGIPAYIVYGLGGLFSLIIIVIISAIVVKVGGREEPTPVETQQVEQQAEQEPQEQEQAKEEKPEFYPIEPQLLQYIQEKNASNPAYWAVVKKVVDPQTGQEVDSQPLFMLANQAIDKAIMANSAYTPSDGGGIRTADNSGVIGFNDPIFVQQRQIAVDTLLTQLSSSYKVRVEKVVFNEAQNIAQVAVVSENLAGTSNDINEVTAFVGFEDNAVNTAYTLVPKMIEQIQALKPSEKVKEENNPEVAIAEAKKEQQQKIADLEAEVKKSQGVIDVLNTNLQETRSALVNTEENLNRTTQTMNTREKQMAEFLQRLESKPSVNQKLNLQTIDERKHGLKVVASMGDRVYLQDTAGEQYTAKVGDVIVLENGKRLTLVNADTKEVTIE